jgi:hypothetical protein
MKGNSWVLPLIVALIILLIDIEFVLPVDNGKKKKKTEHQNK